MNNCRFGNVHCILWRFSNFSGCVAEESSTLLQLREILLRTVRCTVFSLSLSIARKYSILQQTGGDTPILRTVYLIGLFSRDIAFRRLSIFQLLLDWNC